MRAFIAIELTKEIKDYLAQFQNRLKSTGADVKWVQPQNIHLTLKFLGEIDEEGLSEVTRVLQDTLKDKDHFYIRLCSVGAFPKINYPRVIWVGIDKGDKETADIARELEENSEKIGIPAEDRKFSSHITIGRVKSSLNRIRLIQELNHLQNEMAQENSQCHKTLEFIVTKITLFKSTLTPKGPIYEALKEINLRVT